MNNGIVCLSFDDGRKDNIYAVLELLEPMKLPATFNITTGYVDGSCPLKLKPCQKPAMTIDDVVQLHQSELFEVAAHGDCHLNTIDDIIRGKNKLTAWLDMDQSIKLGFASPGSGLDYDSLSNNDKATLANNFIYIRTSLRISHCYTARTLSRKASRVMHSPLLYRAAYSDTLLESTGDFILHSVPVMGDITFAQIKALVDAAAKQKKLLILMLHSIESDSHDPWSWDYAKFEKLCAYLYTLCVERRIAVKTTSSAVISDDCGIHAV